MLSCCKYIRYACVFVVAFSRRDQYINFASVLVTIKYRSVTFYAFDSYVCVQAKNKKSDLVKREEGNETQHNKV